MSKRRKAAPVDVPQTEVEARHLAASYASMVGEIEAIDAERKIRIAEVNRDCDARVGHRAPLLEGMFARLKGWWEAHGERIAGKRRSAKFSGLSIGLRLTPSALKLPKGMKAQEAVEFIQSIAATWPAATSFLRTTVELDKPPLIKLLGNATAVGPMVDRIREEGFRLNQRDEFFVDVLPRDAGDAAL